MRFTLVITLMIMLLQDVAFAQSVKMQILPSKDLPVLEMTLSPQQQQALQQVGTLRVGIWGASQPPFRLDNNDTVFEGLAADYLQLISQGLHMPVTVEHFDSRNEAEAALRNNHINLMMLDRAPLQTQQGLLHSQPWLIDFAVQVVSPNKSSNLPSRFDVKTVTYVGDKAMDNLIQRVYPKARQEKSVDYLSAVAALIYNNFDLMFMNAATSEYLRVSGNIGRLDVSRVVPDIDLSQCFTATEGNAELIAAINAALSQIPPQMALKLIEPWGVDYYHLVRLPPLALTSEEQQYIQQHPVVPVIYARNGAPFAFVDDEGKDRGFTISLLNLIARQTGLRFTFENVISFKEMHRRLQQVPGALLPAADISELSNAALSLSRVYATVPWVIVTRRDYPAVKSLADWNGKKVAMSMNFSWTQEIIEQYPQIKFISSRYNFTLLNRLESGSIDGVLLPLTSANYYLNNYYSDIFHIASAFPVPQARLAMATSPQNHILTSIISKALDQIPPNTFQIRKESWYSIALPSRIYLWTDYTNLIVVIAVLVAMFFIFFYWKNKLLNQRLQERRLYEEELMQAKAVADRANSSKSQFLSQMSHEIRTPLSALIGLLEIEHQQLSSPLQRQQNIDTAWAASRSLHALVGEILDLAKIESGKFAVHPVPMSIAHAMKDVHSLFVQVAHEKGLDLTLNLSHSTDGILFDPVAFKQIASNLTSNAIKFTTQGEVEIAIYSRIIDNKESEFALEVSDTGVGLSEEEQQNIFQPFVQLGESEERQAGTGLGLSICQRLATLLKGELSVESTPGEGSIFIFRFTAAPAGIPEPVRPSAAQQQTRPLEILIVEDHAPNRMLLTQQLTLAGHHVTAVESGEQALLVWREQGPDLIITDCNMPGMSGFTLTEQIRRAEAQQGVKRVPVFGLTAAAETEMLAKTRAAGMDECMFKPIETSTMMQLIDQYCSQSTAETEQPEVLLDKMAQTNPEFFRQFTSAVISENRRDMQQLQTALAQQDSKQVEHHAHLLLGAAGLVKSARLSQVAEQIERAAKQQDLDRVAQLLPACLAAVAEVEERLR